jgi:large subunit ribosomal protein L15
MQLHQVKPIHKPRKTKRVGRGGKKGWTCGRGSKGQSSRSGRLFKPLIRGFFKRYPKLRGYRAYRMPESLVTINLKSINLAFKDKEVVNPRILLHKGLISFPGNKTPKVKILGQGELTKPLVFQNCLFSKSAKDKIEKAGGVVR